MSDLLTIQQIEDIAGTLRKYRLTPDDALVLSQALVHAVDGPVRVQAADLASLMRPRRPAPEPDTAGDLRRLGMRERLRAALPAGAGEILFEHHRNDDAALRSAVQYIARKRHQPYTVARVDDQHALVTLGG